MIPGIQNKEYRSSPKEEKPLQGRNVIPIKGSRFESGTAPAAVFEYVDRMAGRPATGSV